MYQQIIPLSPTQSLVLTWEKGWHSLTIKKDNQIISAFKDIHDLKIGKHIQIPEFGTVFIRMDRDQIEAWQNGKDLATGLVSGQADHFKTAWQVIYVFTLIQVLIICLAKSTGPKMELLLPLISTVLIFGGLAFWAQKAKSVIPLWICTVLVGLGGLASMFVGFSIIAMVVVGGMMFVLIRGARTGPLQLASKAVPINMQEGGPLDAGV